MRCCNSSWGLQQWLKNMYLPGITKSFLAPRLVSTAQLLGHTFLKLGSEAISLLFFPVPVFSSSVSSFFPGYALCWKVKVKQSHYRPEQALRDSGGWGSQISRQLAYVSGNVVSRTHRPPLPPRKYSWYSFLLEADQLQGHSALGRIVWMKNSSDTVGPSSL